MMWGGGPEQSAEWRGRVFSGCLLVCDEVGRSFEVRYRCG